MALGTTLVEIGPRKSIWVAVDGKEQFSALAVASIANLNSKVFGQVEEKDGKPRWRAEDTKASVVDQIKTLKASMNIISGSELVGFWPNSVS